MEINPDIIKKNPEIVQTIKRVRRKLIQTSIYNSNEDHELFYLEGNILEMLL